MIALCFLIVKARHSQYTYESMSGRSVTARESIKRSGLYVNG